MQLNIKLPPGYTPDAETLKEAKQAAEKVIHLAEIAERLADFGVPVSLGTLLTVGNATPAKRTRRSPITDDQEKEMVDRMKRGERSIDIAEAMGLPAQTIARFRKKHGLIDQKRSAMMKKASRSRKG